MTHALRNFRKGVGNKKKTIDAYSEQDTAAIRVRCGRGILGVHALLEAPSKEERHSHPLTRSLELAPSLSLPLSLPPSLVPSLPRSLPRSVDPHPRSSRHILSLTQTAEPDSPRSRAPLTGSPFTCNKFAHRRRPARHRGPPAPLARLPTSLPAAPRWAVLGCPRPTLVEPWSNPGQTPVALVTPVIPLLFAGYSKNTGGPCGFFCWHATSWGYVLVTKWSRFIF